jgi:pimeloyl-ACP methyl ester carboxylesterase
MSAPTPVSVTHHYADLSEVRMHYVTAGEGTPVVLLHGWPQTWYEWRGIIDRLAPHYRVIAPDLRGLGDTSRPAGGYDKKTIAADVWELLQGALKLNDFYLVGHDWGGPTAYALAAHHPDAVKKLAIIDVTIPGDGGPDISQGGKRWHHAFNRTPELPEALVTGREAVYLGWFYRTFAHRAEVMSDEVIAEFLRTYSDPESLAAGFRYYRAVPQDIADNAAMIARFKLPMPVLALGGAESWGRRMEVLESMQRVALDVRGGMIDNCGHFVPEEQPDELARRLIDFFKE